jgi:hypothetical protein
MRVVVYMLANRYCGKSASGELDVELTALRQKKCTFYEKLYRTLD